MRAIGHNLKPIITIAEKGVNEAITAEIERALNDHELIKIKINVNDPEYRKNLTSTLCTEHRSELVQAIGKVALIYRKAKKPNAKLSNLIRPL